MGLEYYAVHRHIFVAVVLSLESDVQDGDTLMIDEETNYTVRISESVHAEDVQTLQIYVDNSDEIDGY